MTEFSERVIRLIKNIPRGNVATYGQIAMLAKNPRGARAVSWILHSSSTAHQLPWQRVINAKGQIAFPFGTDAFFKQKTLLRQEKVVVSEAGIIDLKLYGWKRKISK